MEGKLHAEGLQAMDEDDDLSDGDGSGVGHSSGCRRASGRGLEESPNAAHRSIRTYQCSDSLASDPPLIQEAEPGGATALDRSRFARSPAFALLKFGGGLGRT